MLTASIIFFVLAALGGATLAAIFLTKGSLPPLSLAILHGIAAATGLVLLIIAVVSAATVSDLAKTALVLFILAAIGGGILFSFHLSNKKFPVLLVLGHGLLAVIAFVLLLVFAAS